MSATAPQSQPLEPSTLSWEGDKMFNIYIYDYCFKRGFRQTAQHLMSEAEIPPDAKPPINARQGLLFEWWSVFWVLFTAKASGSGTDEALLYTHHQSQQSTQQRRVVMPNQGSAPGQPGPPGQQIPPRPPMNGITSIGPQGPPGQQTPTSRNFPNGPSNGVPGGIGPGPQVNGIGGPQPPTGGAPTSGQPSQNFPPQMSARLPMGPGNMQQQQHQQRGFTSPSTDPNGHPGGPQHQPGHPPMGMGQSPHINQMGRPGGMMGGGPPGGMGPAQGSAFPPPPPLGRPPSRTQTPSQQGGMMTQQSPSMATRQPPPGGPGAMMSMGGSPGMMNPQMMNPQQQNITEEWSKIPTAAMSSLKGELGIEQHKDLNSLSLEEKMRMIHQWRNRNMRRPPNAVAGPSNGNQLMAPPPPGPQRRPGKRSSTSPPDTTSGAGASPPGKRVRRSPVPGGMATPPTYPMNVPGQHGGPQGGPPGPMGIGPPGPMRPPGMGQPMNGFPPAGPGPGGIGGMQGMHPPSLGGAMAQQMNRDQLHNYRQSMVNQTGQRLQGLAQSPGNIGSPGGPDGGMGGPPGFPGGPGPAVRGGQPQPPPPPHIQQGQQLPGGLQQQQQQQQPGGGQQQPKNMPPPPSPKDLKDGIKTEGSPMGPPPPGSTPSANNSGNASTSQTPTPVPPSPSNSMAPTPNAPGGGPPAPPADMFATDFMGIGAMDMETLDHLTFNNGDINFERDFGQWFNPDEIGTSLDIGTNQ